MFQVGTAQSTPTRITNSTITNTFPPTHTHSPLGSSKLKYAAYKENEELTQQYTVFHFVNFSEFSLLFVLVDSLWFEAWLSGVDGEFSLESH